MNRSGSTWSTGWSRRDCHGPESGPIPLTCHKANSSPPHSTCSTATSRMISNSLTPPPDCCSPTAATSGRKAPSSEAASTRCVSLWMTGMPCIRSPAAHGTVCSQARYLQPDPGTDRLTVSGDANNIIRTIISRIGLSTVFDVPSETSGINISNYSFRRYITRVGRVAHDAHRAGSQTRPDLHRWTLPDSRGRRRHVRRRGQRPAHQFRGATHLDPSQPPHGPGQRPAAQQGAQRLVCGCVRQHLPDPDSDRRP